MENKNKYYPRLRELRVAAGLNQMELADVLGMQQNQYSRYERGERELPMHLFVKLAEHYNVAIVPARVGKPDDKPAAEGSVRFVSTWITASLRDRRFFTLGEAMQAVAEKLEELNRMYEASILAERIRYETLLSERENQENGDA